MQEEVMGSQMEGLPTNGKGVRKHEGAVLLRLRLRKGNVADAARKGGGGLTERGGVVPACN
jgi:hypothetical protein